MNDSYSERLKDPRWQRRRLEILQRSDFSCENCEATDKTLHVHHKLYRKGAMPWEYEDHELEALCEECHERIHECRARLKALIAEMGEYELERLLGYGEAMMLWTGMREPGDKLQLRNILRAEGIYDAIAGSAMGATVLMDSFPSGWISNEEMSAFYRAEKKRRP